MVSPDLSTVETLHEAKLDDKLMEQVKKSYPALLESNAKAMKQLLKLFPNLEKSNVELTEEWMKKLFHFLQEIKRKH